MTEMTAPVPYRRFGEYVESACDRWNADDREAIPIVYQFDSQPVSTPSSTERTYDDFKPAGRRTAHE